MPTFHSKKNRAASKIATVGGINSSDNPVTFSVTTGEGSEFPTANFKIVIDNEILLCTSRTGDSFTCTRAQESTTAAAHSLNADVEHVITAGDVEQIQTAIQNSSAIYVPSTGSSSAYVITLDPVPTAYADGQIFAFKANHNNTGAATLNVNALGAKSLKKMSGTVFADVSANDIINGMIVIASYDSTNGYFQIKSQLSTSSGTTATVASDTLFDAKGDLAVGTAPDTAQRLAVGANKKVLKANSAQPTGLEWADGLESKVITASRDMTAVSGDVAYTGVGFVPSSIVCLAGVDGVLYGSVGVVDSAKTEYCLAKYGASGLNSQQAALVYVDVDGSNNKQVAVVLSFDADGFTLTWTKGGTPTGTLLLTFICFR